MVRREEVQSSVSFFFFFSNIKEEVTVLIFVPVLSLMDMD